MKRLTTNNPALSRLLMKLAAFLVTFVSLIYLALALNQADISFHEAAEIPSHIGFLIACLFGLVHIISISWIFSTSMNLESRLYSSMVFMISQPAKYIPGKVWPIVSQKSLLGNKATSTEILIANAITTWVTTSAMVSAAVIIWLILDFKLLLALPVAAFILCLVVLLPFWLVRISPKRWGIMSTPTLKSSVRIKSAVIYLLLAITTSASAWISLYFFALQLPATIAVRMWGISVGSAATGMASLLPAGLGVREASFLSAGNFFSQLTDINLLWLAAISRIWLVVLDCFSCAVGLLVVVIHRAMKS